MYELQVSNIEEIKKQHVAEPRQPLIQHLKGEIFSFPRFSMQVEQRY